jgi:PAS domain S-box-containing protein
MTQRSLAPRPHRASGSGRLLPIGTLIGFLIAIAAIVMVARLSYGALKDTVSSAERVVNTREVVEHLQTLLSIMQDAETGQRGFALTGDESYLRPYNKAKATLAGEIATAHALVADDPQQQRRLQVLEQLCADKMAELAQTITLLRQADPAGAPAIVRRNNGNDLMEHIRSVTAEMAGEERRILAGHQAEWRGASRVSSFVIVGGAAFLLAFIAVVAFRTSQGHRARQIRIWVRTGQIALSERMLGDQRLDKLADRVLEFLSEYLEVQTGAVYLAEPDGRFRRFASYAVTGRPALDLVRSGDGFLGQAAQENRALHLKEVPEGYLSAGAGLRWSKPIELFVAPASVDGVVYAVIELIFSRRLVAADHTFLARAFESLGVAVRSSKDRTRLEEVLEAAQRQGEELEQTNLQLERQALVLKRQKDDLSMFNSANFSSIATDSKGVIQIFNVGAERMLGYTAEDVVNQVTPADLSDPQEVMSRAKALSVGLATPIAPGFEALVFKASRGIEDIYELTYIRKDGSRFPAVVSVTALRDAEGAIIGYLLIGTDNSARKLAEETLLKAGALQSAIFNSTNFSKIATDAKGVIQIFNIGAERMLGYTAEEVMNKITPADISDPQEIIARAKTLSVELETPIAPGFEALVFKASRGIEDIYELTYIRKDGSRLPAVVSVTALRDAEGAIIGYLLIGTDNTARRRAEEALLKAGALQSAIFNSANFSSIATDSKGVIQIFNVGAERMLGYTAEEVMNKITPADISDPQEIIARAKTLSVELDTLIAPGFEALVFKASRGIEDIYELTYIRKDGSRFPAVVSVTALRDAEDAIIGYLLIGTDNTARKHAEEALLKAGALQNAIFNSANFSSIATDSKGVIQIFNVGAERMLGYAAEEVMNKITPADISDPQEIIARAKTLSVELETLIAPGFEALVFKASRGIEDIYELTYIRKDGSRLPAVVSVTALRDAEGAIIGYLLIGTDNTARKRAEEALLKAGALQSAIFNSANFSSIATDSKGVIQIFNVGAERMLGYAAEEVMNKITPADISDPQEIIARAEALSVELETAIAPGFEALVFKASRGIEDIYELTYIRKDGSRFPAVVSVTALRDAEGAIIGYLLIGTDNTARKQIEAEQAQLGQRLRDHQFYTRSLFESNIDALMTTDAPGIITDVNKQMEALTGCTRDELIGAPFKTFFTDPERAEAGISLALSKRKVTDYELTARDRDGKETVVSYNATTLYDRDRRLQGVFAAVREITERKQYERSLREATHRAEHANSAKSEFLANMSHEIRTPLNAVIGLGYLLEHTTLNEDQRQLLSKIQFGGRALLGVINNVLDLSKIEAGEMSLEDEPFDLPELVRDLGQMLTPQAVAKGIELIVQCAPAMPRTVKGDASRLRQVLTNLLGNSIKFTESGHVELKVFCTEQSSDRIRMRCTVQDTGIGIESAALERLFTPFTQADASTTRRFGGTGLGLSIARRFVELMGGEIGVTSTVTVGSTFWIEIPLRIAHDFDGTLSAHGLSIVVADSGGDAPERLLAMSRALGWSPKVAETGEQLLEAMRNTQPIAWPDVLILELHLHDMDAHQLIARLQRECAHGELPPVIIVADLAQSYMDHQQLMRSTDIMLVRPITSSALFNAVNAAVSKQPDSLERVLQSTKFDELRAQWLAGVRVLVADDSDINLEVAQRILEKQGAIVTTCSDGLAALEHVRVHHQFLDIVLMDVQMPNLDGNEATRRVRGELQLKMLPIVALTAGALVGERQRALEAGMNDFISKPFDPQALIRKVRRLVEQARGEPIEMVLDTEPVRQARDGPLMASIDAGVVQQMFGDDLPMFKSLLARMLREFADLALPIAVPPDDETTRNEIKARTHKLKGSAGMIGATKVMRLAGAAEIALQDCRPAEFVEGILRQLAMALTTLREEAECLQASPEPDAGAGAKVVQRPNIGNADIEELCALLECQNLAAIDKFELISPSLSGLVGAVRFDRLRDAIDNLNFQLGAELLRETLLVGENAGSLKAHQAGLSHQ